jgi:hypothetical protein
VVNASTIGQIEIPLVRSDNLIIAGCIAVGLIALFVPPLYVGS